MPSQPISIGQEDVNPFDCTEPTIISYHYFAPINRDIKFCGKIHGSVGIHITPDYDKSYFEMDIEGCPPANCDCGGDEFSRKYIFTPKQKGKTTIIFNHLFRGILVKQEIFNLDIN